MSELWELSSEAIRDRVQAAEVSAMEVLEAALRRTSEVEPRVCAYLSRFEEQARKQATEVDRKQRSGEPLGALAGVPVALKDNLSLAKTAVTCGSKILQGYISPYSATAVQKLLAADAVVLGKTNMDEFAMGSSCENSAFQVTRNPWNLQMVPGGSSGGSAAAVAASSVPLAFGSDTGGSIRQPAAFCGVVGLKPTYGRVSRYGLVAFASSLDQIGPLSHTVRDAALGLSVIAGSDSLDSTSVVRQPDDYLAAIEEGVSGLKLGVIKEVDTESLEAGTRQNWEGSLELLSNAGADLVEVSIPQVRAAIAVYYVLANCEASANLARFDGIRYGRRASEAKSLQELYLDSRREGFGSEVKRRIMLGTYALSAGYYDAYYGQARGVLEVMRNEFDSAFRCVDVLLTPTSPGGAFAIGEKADDPLSMYLMDIYTTPASLVGIPGLAVPSGLDSRGLPLSLQIMARPFEEAMALRVGRTFERLVGWEARPNFSSSDGRLGGCEIA